MMQPNNGVANGRAGLAGLAGLAPSAMLAIPKYSRQTIVDMVQQDERDKEALVRRMEGDYDLYTLVEHVNYDLKTQQALTDYASYTTALPRVYADKVMTWEEQADLLIRVPHLDVEGHQEEQDNLKERFAIGCLTMADELLAGRAELSIRRQSAFNVTVRGGYVGGRALLRRNSKGKVVADVLPFDPMHTHFEMGEDGLEWICHKTRMTRRQIRRIYGVELGGGGAGKESDGSQNSDLEGVDVYDFYDRFYNTVVTDSDTLKPPTPHLFTGTVPAYLTLVGQQPILHQRNRQDLIAGTGESIFANVRGIISKINDVLSILQEMTARARRQTLILESRGGQKTPESDVRSGEDVALEIGEKLHYLEQEHAAAETMAYLEFLIGELQRATIPFSSYGALQFQLSGFAINTLRQAVETVLSSRLEALQDIYKQIINLLFDQFMTGMWDGMQLSGRDRNRKFFKHNLDSRRFLNEFGEAVTCDYEVALVSQLPQDDATRWNIAQTAKTLGILSDESILDNVLHIQDSQQEMDKVRAQKAEGGLPEVMLMALFKAAMDRSPNPSDPNDYWAMVARHYKDEHDRLMMVKYGVMPDTAPQGQGQSGGGLPSAAKPPGPRPEAMPYAMTGAPPPGGQSNNGPARVAPGTPRPAAQGQQDQNPQL